MKVLFVYAHPNPKSFAHAILEQAMQTAKTGGHEVVVRDLYDLKFDPILKSEDFAQMRSGHIPADIKKEQEYIQWADVMVMIYPLWWTGFPAMMKGYIDRSFSYGFAFSMTEKGPVGLLKGKKVILFTNQGTPAGIYEATGMFNSLKQTSDAGILQYCGLDVIDHKFFAGVPNSDLKTREGYLAEVARAIANLK